MKRLLLALLLVSQFAFAQDDEKSGRIELRYGVGNLKLRNFNSSNNSTYKVDAFNIYGLNSVFLVDKKWAFELGVNYIPVKYTITPPTGTIIPQTNEQVNLASIPLKARYNLMDYIFVNAGLLVDVEIKNTGAVVKQSGFGLSFGFGAKYDLNNGLGLFVNPEINLRSLSRTVKNPTATLTDTSVNFGLAYSF